MTAQIPTTAGPDTVCACGHWWEEHFDGMLVFADCAAPHCVCARFEFDPAANTPDEIADRGGDPDAWPQWVKDYYSARGMVFDD
jgi:hypothetical protein